MDIHRFSWRRPFGDSGLRRGRLWCGAPFEEAQYGRCTNGDEEQRTPQDFPTRSTHAEQDATHVFYSEYGGTYEDHGFGSITITSRTATRLAGDFEFTAESFVHSFSKLHFVHFGSAA